MNSVQLPEKLKLKVVAINAETTQRINQLRQESDNLINTLITGWSTASDIDLNNYKLNPSTLELELRESVDTTKDSKEAEPQEEGSNFV